MHANVRYCFWGACLFSSVLVVAVIRFLSSRTASRPSISRLVMDLVSRNSRPKAEPDRSCRPCCCPSGFSGLSSSSSRLPVLYTLLDSWSVLNVLDLPDQTKPPKKTFAQRLDDKPRRSENSKERKSDDERNTKCFLVLDAVCNKAQTRCVQLRICIRERDGSSAFLRPSPYTHAYIFRFGATI